MTISRERFASRQLRRLSDHCNNQEKESFIDITVASSCNNDDSNSSDDSINKSRKSSNMKDLELIDRNDLVARCLLGKGGFSNVFEMHHRKTGRVFAVKQLRDSVRKNQKKLAVCAGELAVETAILANLNHENIIKLHGIRGDGNITDHLKKGTFFLCLDSLEETLYDKMAEWREQASRRKHRFLRGNSRRMKEDSTIVRRLEDVAVGIVKGMEYLHSKNIIYRDLKPGNIGFDEETGKVKIFDFGLARIVSDGTDESGNSTRLMTQKVGTPRYVAPEIARGMTNYGFGVDVYSFSILLWQLVTDRVAFDHFRTPSQLKRAVVIEKLRPPIECVPKILLAPQDRQISKAFNFQSKKTSFASADRLTSSPSESEEVQDLIESCWSDCPERRPTFRAIRKELEYIIKNSAVRNQKRRKSGVGFLSKFTPNQ